MELRIEGSITERERLESSRPRDSAMEFGFRLGPGSNHYLRAPFHRFTRLTRGYRVHYRGDRGTNDLARIA